MFIVLNEENIKQALAIYMKNMFTQPVEIASFDLSGTRSKEGLTISIDLLFEGENRKPADEPTKPVEKPDIPNVKPKETASQLSEEELQLVEDKKNLPELSPEDSENISKLLTAISENNDGSNDGKIKKLLTILFSKANTADHIRSIKAVQKWLAEYNNTTYTSVNGIYPFKNLLKTPNT